MKTHYPVIAVGCGQAGLSMSYCLKQRGIDRLVFERNQLAESWRSKRWDSFCLVTPNWQCQLPGFPYPGDDPHGFMVKEEIVAYIEAYARSFSPPLHEGITVKKLARTAGGGFSLETTFRDFTAEQVIIATGGYHTATIPRIAERFSPEIVQLHSSEYKSASGLPPGDVLVVGTGRSGCQIAEDLHLAGRRVHLCVTGRDGGRNIDLRKFALEGMQLHGRLLDVRGTTLHFGEDLRQNLDHADTVAESIKNTIDKFIVERGIDAPIEPRYSPVWEPANEVPELDYAQAGITSIIWSMGYRSDYSWIEIPVFNGQGYPSHERVVTSVPGIYFLGLPWQYTWGSGRFSGVARDAEFLAERIAARASAEPAPASLNELAPGS